MSTYLKRTEWTILQIPATIPTNFWRHALIEFSEEGMNDEPMWHLVDKSMTLTVNGMTHSTPKTTLAA